MKLESADFQSGQDIPVQFACTGRDVSPSLVWDDVPPNTRSFALIVVDPDAPAGTWTHWIAWNIPADRRALPEGLGALPRLDDGTLQGQNDFRKTGYGGPCPPQGHGAHRYFFNLYALDTLLDLKAGASRAALERAVQGHVLARSELMGKFSR